MRHVATSRLRTRIPRDKSSQFVDERKKREINSHPKASLVTQDRFFFFSTFHRRRGKRTTHAMRIATCITHVDINRDSSAPLPLSRKKREKKRFWEHEGGRMTTGGSRRDRDRFDEESERARAAPKPYSRRSKESSVFSATMVTKRTGRSLSQPSLLRSIWRSSSSIYLSSTRPAVHPTVKRARASRLIAPN